MGRRTRTRPRALDESRSADIAWRKRVGVAGVLVFVLAFAAFVPAIGAGFSDFDDHGFLLEATGWRGLSPGNLAWIFTAMRLGHYQPLTYLSYAIDHAFFGMDPRAYHVTNILLHAGNAALLMIVILRVLVIAGVRQGAPLLYAAMAASALWAVHPLRVESVAWITERRDVLSAFFLLLSVLAYLRAARPAETALASRGALAWCVVLLGLSLFAKAWGITLIGVVLVLDVWPLRRLPWRVWRWGPHAPVLREKAPIAAMCLLFGVLAWLAQRTGHAEAMRSFQDWGWIARGFQTCYGLVFYLWKTIAPVGLVPLYELPLTFDAKEPRWWIAAVLVLVFALATLRVARRRPGVGAAIMLYVIILSPVLGIAQSGIQLVADRYSYLALWPIAGVLAAGLAALGEGERSRQFWRTSLGLCVVAAVVLGLLSWRQSMMWGDTLSMWQTTIERGYDTPVVRNYYARQLEKAGRLDDAAREYEHSLRQHPRYEDSWFGLGNTRRAQRQFNEAEAAFQESIAVASDPMRSQIALGLLYIMHMNRHDDAIAAFAAAAESARQRGDPQHTGTPYLMLASAYGQTGQEAKAVPWLREAARWPDTRDQALVYLRDLGLAP